MSCDLYYLCCVPLLSFLSHVLLGLSLCLICFLISNVMLYLMIVHFCFIVPVLSLVLSVPVCFMSICGPAWSLVCYLKCQYFSVVLLFCLVYFVSVVYIVSVVGRHLVSLKSLPSEVFSVCQLVRLLCLYSYMLLILSCYLPVAVSWSISQVMFL